MVIFHGYVGHNQMVFVDYRFFQPRTGEWETVKKPASQGISYKFSHIRW